MTHGCQGGGSARELLQVRTKVFTLTSSQERGCQSLMTYFGQK